MISQQDKQENMNKISWSTRFAYGGGDMACNIVWGAMSILTFFYTDYAGISPVIVGLVMMSSRCFDGFSDIVMGFIVERTKSKYGKARPWILWMCVPFTISLILIFTVPQTTETLQFLYLFVTYNLCTTICYTTINLPYSSLSALMTKSSKERDMLSIVRQAMSPCGKIIAVSATLPLIKIFGNDQAAWVKVMSIWAVVALILLLICFFKSEEKISSNIKAKVAKIPIKKSLYFLLSNKYFWLAMILWMMQNVIFCVTATLLPYYCKYIFNNESFYSILYLIETGTMVGFTFVSPMLLRKFGKRNMSLIGVCLALAGHLIYLLDPLNFYFLLFSCIIRGIGFAPLNSVLFGFFGDVVEYAQWKYNVRQEGLIFSGGSVGTKVGFGVTGAILTGLLSSAGYVTSTTASAVQPQSAIDMIVNLYIVAPIVVWLIIIIVLWLYKLDKLYPQIMRDLIQREFNNSLK